MSIKRVFYLTPNHLTVYRWQNGEIYEDLEIPSHNDSQAIFSSDHFASMHGVTNGDWTHGLLHPDQMIGERCLVDGTGDQVLAGPAFAIYNHWRIAHGHTPVS